MKRVLDLTLRLADGTASEAECRELDRLIESDRRARRMHLEMMEVEAALRTSRVEADEADEQPDRSLSEERTVQAVLESVRKVSVFRLPRRRLGTRPIWAAVGVVAVAASVAMVFMPRAAHKRRTAASSSSAFGSSRPAPVELRSVTAAASRGWSSLPIRVQSTRPAGVSRIEVVEGVVLEIRGTGALRAIEQPASVAAAVARRLVVDEGTVALEVERDRALPQLLFVTPHAQVVTRARKALLTISADATRIDVQDGTAAVSRTRDGTTIELHGRQSVIAGADEGVVARTLPGLLFIEGQRSGRFPTEMLDRALVRHLEGLGFWVDVVDEVDLRANHLAGKALVMISPSASEVLGDRIDELGLASAGVPVICSRPSLFADLSMTPPGTDSGDFASNATRLEILEPIHPLAAGLSGPVQVTEAPGHIGWGQPEPEALRVAAFPDVRKSNRAAIFAYERGASMAGSARAPARRVGFFIHPDLGPYLTHSGWALLDAAVRWAAGDQ